MHLSSNRSYARTNQNVRIWVIIIYKINYYTYVSWDIYIMGGTVASWLVRSTLERAVWV